MVTARQADLQQFQTLQKRLNTMAAARQADLQLCQKSIEVTAIEDLDEEVERRVERRWEGVEDEEDFDEEVKELGASEFAHLIKDKKHWLAIKKAKVRKIEEGDSEVMTLKDFSI